MLARVARRCMTVRPVRAVRLVSAARVGARATVVRGLATAAPAKGGAAKAPAADAKAPAAAKGKGKGDAAPAAEDAAAAPAAAVKRVASSEGDMMSDAQRSKALAARKAALPGLEERVRVAPNLYSAQPALNKLPKTDAGKYIKIDAAALPDSIRHAIQEELDMTGDYVMVRNDLYQLIGALRTAQLKQHSVLIDGGRGVGKSMALALCVLHAKQRGALVLATRGEEFLRDTYGQIAANKQRDGVFDQPRLTLRYVRALRDGQAEALRKIQLKAKYDFNAPAQAAADAAAEGKAPAALLPAPVTLFDLVAHAATGRLAAAKYWYDIIAEIRLATEVPVLIAADGVNWWHHRSELLHPERAVPIRGSKLALADGFLELFKSPPRNGTCVFTTTSHARDRYVKELYQMATMQFVVGGYTDAEMHAALQHYSVSKLIVSTLDADYKNRVKALSGNVPTDVFEHVLIT